MVKLSSGIELNPNELTSEDREAIVKALEETKSGIWKPKKGERYWGINELYAYAWESTNNESTADRNIQSFGLAFPTEEAANKHLTYLKALQVLRGDTKGYEYKGPDAETYWTVIEYKGRLETCNYEEVLDVIRFRTQEDAQASLDAHHDLWKIVLGG